MFGGTRRFPAPPTSSQVNSIPFDSTSCFFVYTNGGLICLRLSIIVVDVIWRFLYTQIMLTIVENVSVEDGGVFSLLLPRGFGNLE